MVCQLPNGSHRGNEPFSWLHYHYRYGLSFPWYKFPQVLSNGSFSPYLWVKNQHPSCFYSWHINLLCHHISMPSPTKPVLLHLRFISQKWSKISKWVFASFSCQKKNQPMWSWLIEGCMILHCRTQLQLFNSILSAKPSQLTIFMEQPSVSEDYKLYPKYLWHVSSERCYLIPFNRLMP